MLILIFQGLIMHQTNRAVLFETPIKKQRLYLQFLKQSRLNRKNGVGVNEYVRNNDGSVTIMNNAVGTVRVFASTMDEAKQFQNIEPKEYNSISPVQKVTSSGGSYYRRAEASSIVDINLYDSHKYINCSSTQTSYTFLIGNGILSSTFYQLQSKKGTDSNKKISSLPSKSNNTSKSVLPCSNIYSLVMNEQRGKPNIPEKGAINYVEQIKATSSFCDRSSQDEHLVLYRFQAERIKSKVETYTTIVVLITLLQIPIIMQQVREPIGQAAHLSITSVFYQSTMDAALCVGHLLTLFALPQTFSPSFYWIVLFKFVLYSIFHMRLIIEIYHSRYSFEISQSGWYFIRSRLSNLNSRFYTMVAFILIIGTFTPYM